ncbi:MAG TPA: hypothetical protein VHD84_02205 [Candidatus Saccharimonadales bacterium]|nr:hypothetical protein [Candidatus Saccharimonadales bacterium]
MAVTAEALANENAEVLIIRENEYSQLGQTALEGVGIEFSELGVNDYATHLDQYLRYGEAALPYIEEDLITDSAERMVRSKYINEVSFRRQGDDFLSKKGNFSMRRITANTQDRIKANEATWELRKRAEIEAREIDKLNEWFEQASVDEFFVVDSLPVAENEVYAVKRLYRKSEDGGLSMSVIILHNPSIKVFNEYHKKIGADVPSSINAMGILENCYVIGVAANTSTDEFIRSDVDIYDSTLADHNRGQEFVFGIPVEKAKEIPNSNDVIRRQKSLLDIYKKSIRALGQSNWTITPELAAINEDLGLKLNFKVGETLDLNTSRNLLGGVHQYIMATLNNASGETLDMLAGLDDGDKMTYQVAGHYGSESRSAGIRYESSACPTAIGQGAATEQAGIHRAFRHNQDPSQCGTCPKCNKEYFVPNNVYKKEILECNNCHAAIHFDGSPVSREELEGLHQSSKGILDILLEPLAEFNRQFDLEQARKKAAELREQK